MIKVQTPTLWSNRLNKASAKVRCYPWDKDIIDWSVPINNVFENQGQYGYLFLLLDGESHGI